MVNAESRANIISVRGLSIRFGEKIVHEDLDIDVFQGEILTLLGRSGSGKSVFLRALIGLEKPWQGSCIFNGHDLFKCDDADWVALRKEIGYAFQGGALFDSLSVAENIAYPLEEHKHLDAARIEEKVVRTLGLFGLEGTGDLLPASLSGGMQKRVGLARAIMLDPCVILYDEPTAGLDPGNSKKISDLILKLKEMRKTSIVVTHDIACALRVSDRIAYIHGGRIAALQEIDAVKRDPHPLIAAYFNGDGEP